MARYIVDPSHSTVGFTVRHAGIGKTRGFFSEFSGEIEMPNADSVEGLHASGKILAETVNTNNNDRDTHLRSPDFFDIENFPTWTFTSTGAAGTLEDFVLSGDLTIHGVTQPVELEVTFEGAAVDPFGVERVAFEASTTLSRKSFDLTWNAVMEAGGVLVSDKIVVNLEIEAIKED